jgi:carbon-monoxide dehydrogenase iron sulfur subunit
MTKNLLIVDPIRCTGCGQCEFACSSKHREVHNSNGSRLHIVNKNSDDGFYLPVTCQHCEDPPCMAVCPKEAIYRDDTLNGVLIDRDLCIGCRMCVSVCPSGAMEFDSDRGRAYKCDLCEGNPACVRVCDVKALDYVEGNKLQYPRMREAAHKLYALTRSKAA